jgi:2-succinyl-5-enolpyruvyl-6-hydroxy-3-cyclohexene-1-carboxylate synthase
MLHPKQHITDLAEICYRKGIEHIVISPGSRNAPLIAAFVKRFGDQCISLVDERSAGYFSLGLARAGRKPVVMISTSGTAVLNYAPALAEAYYQHIPLLAITADRPPELIDQQDNQTIRQENVYRNFIKRSYQLPTEIGSRESLQRIHTTILEAIAQTRLTIPGPVHLNVPLQEPLYDPLPEASNDLAPGQDNIPKYKGPEIPDEFRSHWNEATQIMIIHGHSWPELSLPPALGRIADDPRVVLVTENISNVSVPGTISNPEMLLAHREIDPEMAPDLLIYSAGQVVSKRLKNYLRGITIPYSWRIGADEYPIDTFMQKNRINRVAAEVFYQKLVYMLRQGPYSDFKNYWLGASEASQAKSEEILKQLPFCDIKAFEQIFKALPPGVILELGNSSIIRYSQIFRSRDDTTYFSNRGVSGIDGCLSAAVGTAFASDRLTLSVLGDLSFVYDSNALWNERLPHNLRIIVINNHGGDIFNLIKGPDKQAFIQPFLMAHHPVSIQKLAEAFNLNYFCSRNPEELGEQLNWFFKPGKQAALLEIITPQEQNAISYRMLVERSQ